LEATLGLYLVPEFAFERVPILKMITEDKASIKKRTIALLKVLNKQKLVNAWIEDGTSYIGGGSAPMNELPTHVIKIESEKHTADKIARILRKHKPSVIGRISNNAFVIDLRTVMPQQVKYIQSAIEGLA